ncbi:adenine phosphoribosyltransferase [Sulfobacillus acidophilus TPY]|uniref:Adenine phosphoribosyltransferase n=1 Tax=Sulfobacillus acidophilus (strain ATCC 700253 / DSM 10332 / NAL) TaxID=679936 RepID=G8TXT2_SULAD|nr:adenine phosphoribosyltransferase [Sulfobacillus acidophilus TPY]AEW05038.1 adenine phosphoribosyltransferase [Sulfobacillus acidophilus DSM 10332]
MQWLQYVREIPDFPEPGVLFRDILPVLAHPDGLAEIVQELEALIRPWQPEVIMAPEARGFLLAGPLAFSLNVGLVAVRKPGKLPAPVIDEAYTLEYGENHLQMEAGLPLAGKRVVIVDDVLATGGTVAAAARLAHRAGAEVVGFAFLIELVSLQGRSRLSSEVPVGALTAL